MPQVFICYSRKDAAFVDKLTSDLRAAGIHTWCDVDDIPRHIASNTVGWRDAIEQALDESSDMIVVLSPDALESDEVKAEWNQFIQQKKPIYPVQYRDCETPYRLNILQVWDFRTEYDKPFELLAQRLSDELVFPQLNEALSVQKNIIPLLRVHPLGRDGAYPTIQQAVDAAPIGAQILISPGRYGEPLRIAKQIELVGDGPLDEVIIYSSTHYSIQIAANHAAIRNITVRNRPKTRKDAVGIDVQEGHLVVEDCRIIAERNYGIRVTGIATHADIRRCEVNLSRRGIAFTNKAEGEIDSCQIFENGIGVDLYKCSDVQIKKSQIYQNKKNGIHIMDAELPCIVYGCDIYENRGAGIQVFRSTLDLDTANINRNGDVGIFASWSGKVTIKNSNLTGNQKGTLRVSEGISVEKHNVTED